MNRIVQVALPICLAIAAPALALAPQLGIGGQWEPRDVPYPGTIQISVDVSDVERGIFRVREVIPVKGMTRITLLFPKWVPGNHAATAAVEKMAGLRFSSRKRELAWKRDPVDMHAFHVEIPRSAAHLEAEFQFLSPTSPDQGRVVATPEMLNLQWFSTILYPSGYYARQITMAPRVTFPSGWKYTSQLETASKAGPTVQFKPVNMEALIDSPIFAGRHFRRFDLGAIGAAPVSLDVVADAPESLIASEEGIEAHRRLVQQVGALFGPPPFPRYNFMLALTRELGGIGTEHLASSENSSVPEYFTDWRSSYVYRALLPHEIAHAWNGKARRPADLWTPDFNQPMRNSMLWIYEGQAHFWGFVLAARSGLMTRQQVMDILARFVAAHEKAPGRRWRALEDTGNDAIMTRYLVDVPSPSWHRTLGATYEEAHLVWLEVDGLIRELSGERRNLDDFARSFFAGGGERPSLYDFDDVVAALNQVQPYDWTAFLKLRVQSTAPFAPADWLRRSGYRLIYEDSPTASFTDYERRNQQVDLSSSLGLVLSAEPPGRIAEVVWDSPAFKTGLTAGATIVAVNGRSYSPERLKAAINGNRDGANPISLVVNNRNRVRTATFDYRGGLRYPRLERVTIVPDRLGALFSPK